ncbi:MAG: hypothetical protein HZA51_00085 [Planctomycetes bacterium]|nr:hypothetical protein [Planctomycetota bacterium]
MENIRHQPLGGGTVDDLNLPDEFLRRAADRIIRQSYEERHRAVLPDGLTKANAPPGESDSAPNVPAITIHRFRSPTGMVAYRNTLREDRPPVRGFRAPIQGEPIQEWPFEQPAESATPDVRKAADVVARRLARDGLLATTSALVDVVGEKLLRKDAADLLRRVGIPVDLLACFGASEHDGSLQTLLHEMDARRRKSSVECEQWLANLPFTWKPCGFRVALDNGAGDCAMVRLQLTRGDYWDGVGDGCSVDIARQLIAKLPDAKFVVHIEDRFVNQFLQTARTWPLGERGRVTVLPDQETLGQWAQDNAKVGFIRERNGHSAVTKPVTLVPRYASRREDGSVFVPGESFLANRLKAAGHDVRQSRLLFQGGNLIAVRDPKSNKCVLLIGEAEIYRNTALGLTRDQVEAAFRTEFGVDECLVLPAVSYHIDYEASFREHDKKLIAFVNDSVAAREIVLNAGLDCLEAAGVLSADARTIAKGRLDAHREREFLSAVMGPILQTAAAHGGFPASLARRFSTGPVDSGVGNLQRFLLALDLLAAETLPSDAWPQDEHSQAFRRAILRRREDRKRLWDMLANRGWELRAIPSFSEEGLSMNYLNGIQSRRHYIMPAYGGLFEQLDKAAQRLVSEGLPKDVEVVPVLCGESQRRVGAVRCSTGVYPWVHSHTTESP